MPEPQPGIYTVYAHHPPVGVYINRTGSHIFVLQDGRFVFPCGCDPEGHEHDLDSFQMMAVTPATSLENASEVVRTYARRVGMDFA